MLKAVRLVTVPWQYDRDKRFLKITRPHEPAERGVLMEHSDELRSVDAPICSGRAWHTPSQGRGRIDQTGHHDMYVVLAEGNTGRPERLHDPGVHQVAAGYTAGWASPSHPVAREAEFEGERNRRTSRASRDKPPTSRPDRLVISCSGLCDYLIYHMVSEGIMT